MKKRKFGVFIQKGENIRVIAVTGKRGGPEKKALTLLLTPMHRGEGGGGGRGFPSLLEKLARKEFSDPR